MIETSAQLAANIAEPLQILASVANPLLGFAASLLVARDASRLLHKELEVSRARLHQSTHGALLDDGVAAGAKTGAKEEVGHILAAALLAVDLVIVGAVTQHFAAHRNFGKTAKFTGDPIMGIVEHQFDRGATMGAAIDGAIEDDIGHVLATQMAGRALSQHPAHRIDHVGFATAVRAHHGSHVCR